MSGNGCRTFETMSALTGAKDGQDASGTAFSVLFRLLAAEECTPANSVGRRLAAHLLAKGIPVKGITFADIGPGFVTHGTTAQLRRLCGLDGESLYRKAWEVCGNGNG